MTKVLRMVRDCHSIACALRSERGEETAAVAPPRRAVLIFGSGRERKEGKINRSCHLVRGSFFSETEGTYYYYTSSIKYFNVKTTTTTTTE